MAEIGSAFVTIAPSARGFGKQLDSDISGDLDNSGKSGGKRFGSAFGSAAKVGLAAGGIAIAAFAKSAIGAASDLSESTSKVGVVFGKQADQIVAASKKSATAMGLSQQAYLEATGTLGNLLVSLDIAPKKAASLSTEMVKLAGDLASFNNASPEEALEALKSGLTGETEPLKRFGVNMNDATLRAQALKLGLIKTTKDALTPQTKALAAQALIMEQTKTAQGDFARTSGGLANQQRILAAEVEDVKAKIGTALLPVITKVATYLSSTVVPAFAKFVTGMQNGTGAGGKVASTLHDVYNAAVPIAATIGKLVGAFAGLPGSTQKVILLAGAALLLKNHFAGSMPSISSFNREATVTALKAVAIKGAAVGAAAGLAALASKAGGANTELGALATVGAGIATGFAVGGPLGAAIGGLSGVLAVFTSRSAAATAAQQKFDSAGKTVAATLNQQTGALESATRATAAKTLADNGAFTAAQKVGVSYKDVLNAALGNEAATRRVDAATREYIKTNATNYDSTIAAGKVAGVLTTAIHGTSAAIDNERKKIDQVNEAMGKAKDKTVTFTVKTVGVSSSPGTKWNIPGNAKGTDNWRGGMTWVGEEGPELINLAKGAQVIPNHKIGDIGPMSASVAGASSTPSLDGSTITIMGGGVMADSFQGIVNARSARVVQR